MKLRIEVDSSPISVILSSISITKELSGRTSSAQFSIPITDDSTIIPSQQSVIEIRDDDTDDLIFAGLVVRVETDQKNHSLQFWSVTCAGWELLLQSTVISRTWTGKTDAEIIQDAFNDLLPEIDASGIDTLAVALDFEAKDLNLRELLERLSSISGAEWYITADKTLVWRAEGSATAPFGISNSPNNTTTFAWRNFKPNSSSVGFANRVTILGAFTGTGGVELRATAENSTSIADIGVRAAVVVARDIDNQPALDLAASIELDRRAFQESITFEVDRDGLEVGQLIAIHSSPAGISDDYVIQTLKLRQRSPGGTVYEASVGDNRVSIAERLRQLDRIKTGPKLVAVPPAVVLPDSITSTELADGAVTTLKLAVQAVNESRIEVGAVTDSILAAAAVTNTKIADNAISTPKLQAGSVVAATLASNSVVAGKINAGAVTAGTIAAGSITAAQGVFATAAIVNADIANGAITTAKIGSAQITNALIDTVSASKLTAGTIDASVITVSNLSASNITSGTLSVSRLAAGSITGTLLANGTVADVNIASGLSASKVTTGTLNCSLLTVTNVSASSITTGTLNASVVTVSNLSASSITTGTLNVSVIAAGSIVGTKLTNGTITDTQIANATITSAKIVSLDVSKLNAGTVNVGSGGITIAGTSCTIALGSSGLIMSGVAPGIQCGNILSGGSITFGSSLIGPSGNTVINSSRAFVGAGVDCPSNGIGGAGFATYQSGYYFGVTGPTSFTTVDGKTCTVRGGLIVSIV